MKDFQQRVVEEKAELADKLEKLTYFMTGEVFDSLPTAEQKCLYRQSIIMDLYLIVLNERIEAFN